jgi:predicted metal-dependent hydrolase
LIKHGFSKEHEDAVACDSIDIPYRYRRSGRRTIGICVRPDLSVTVTAPQGTTVQEIKDFVRKRAAWIVKAWSSLEQRPKRTVPTYENGEAHLFIGNKYRLQVGEGQRDSVRCESGFLMVTSRNAAEPERTKRLLDSWYRKQAALIFRVRLNGWHEKVLGKEIPLPMLRIRQMKSRWGSCSSTGRITLNLSLIKTPPECIDYVIVHELCHLKVMGHGPDFWSIVEMHVPDYKRLRKELRTYG